MKEANKRKYKNLKGIIVPQNSYEEDSLALLTTDGQTLPIMKNEKFQFLKNLLWESVNVFGRMQKIEKRELLEVLFFTSSHSPVQILEIEDRVS